MNTFPCYKIPGWLWLPKEVEEVCNDLFLVSYKKIIIRRIERTAPMGHIDRAEDIYHGLYYHLRTKGFPDFDPRKGTFLPQYFCQKRIDFLCKNQWKKLVPQRDAYTEDFDQMIPSAAGSPADVLCGADLLKALSDCIESLPPRLKQVIVLYLEKKSYQEIAEELDISTTLVGNRIHHAKKALRECLKRKGYFS